MRTIKFPLIVGVTPARKCPNCETEIEPERPALEPGELLAVCLNPPNGESVNISEMAVRLPIAMKLRAANGKLKLEEAEWETLKACVEKTQFVLVNEDVYAVCRSVLDAPLMEQKED